MDRSGTSTKHTKYSIISRFLVGVSLVFLLLVTLSSCATPVETITPEVITGLITGSISTTDSLLFPAHTVVYISLADNTFEEPVEIAKQIIKNPQVNPLNFSLRYDKADVSSYRSYFTQFPVYDMDGKLIYRSPSSLQVLTKGFTDTVRVQLVKNT